MRQGVHPVLARLYAARGVRDVGEIRPGLERLHAPDRLHNATRAATLLADAIERKLKLLIIADYDCDGATACAIAVRTLRAMGATVDYLVPNRFEFGYGLSPDLVRLAAQRGPDLLITVDNGIASMEGVALASELGMATLITDHHLPGPLLPDAACIVNPNQPACGFPSKHLAGVGVMFYVLLQLRALLRAKGWFAARVQPNLGDLLDLVALGTVADLVRLDANNRLLVQHGLARIRQGRAHPGLMALFHVAGRDPRKAGAADLGFAVGPRINAAGRLADMSLGIECLLAEDYASAANLAQQLDRMNRERRSIESDMQQQAEAMLQAEQTEQGAALTLFDQRWHQGIVGLIASRVKERVRRPTFAFARAGDGMLKGSGRSIAGVHLRDVLDCVSKNAPEILIRFGGHAMAAGATLHEHDLARFAKLFAQATERMADADALNASIVTDGSLEPVHISADLALALDEAVWGQGFAEPMFSDEFLVVGQRLVKERHSKLRLVRAGREFDAILFNSTATLPAKVQLVYRPQLNEFGGQARIDLRIEHWRAIEPTSTEPPL